MSASIFPDVFTISGIHALRIARRDGIKPVRRGQALIRVRLRGWTSPADGIKFNTYLPGYRVADYFRNGIYLGPDSNGTEPVFGPA